MPTARFETSRGALPLWMAYVIHRHDPTMACSELAGARPSTERSRNTRYTCGQTKAKARTVQMTPRTDVKLTGSTLGGPPNGAGYTGATPR